MRLTELYQYTHGGKKSNPVIFYLIYFVKVAGSLTSGLCPWWAQLPKQRVPENADELAFKVNWETDVQPLWDH